MKVDTYIMLHISSASTNSIDHMQFFLRMIEISFNLYQEKLCKICYIYFNFGKMRIQAVAAIWGVCLTSEFLVISWDCWEISSVSSWTTSKALDCTCCWRLSTASFTSDTSSSTVSWALKQYYWKNQSNIGLLCFVIRTSCGWRKNSGGSS